MQRVAIFVGAEVPDVARPYLDAMRWVHVRTVRVAEEIARTLQPDVVMMWRVPRVAAAVGTLRRAAEYAAIVVSVEREREIERRAVLAAGAQFYGAPRPDLNRMGLIEASIRAAILLASRQRRHLRAVPRPASSLGG